MCISLCLCKHNCVLIFFLRFVECDILYCPLEESPHINCSMNYHLSVGT